MKFAILHHGACAGTRFHYRIDSAGGTQTLLPESKLGEHPLAIGIVVDGDADRDAPTDDQIAALQALLLQLKSRYPHLQIGGHRQIRGTNTTCPGKVFPLSRLRDWADHELVLQRNAAFQEIVEEQYRP